MRNFAHGFAYTIDCFTISVIEIAIHLNSRSLLLLRYCQDTWLRISLTKTDKVLPQKVAIKTLKSTTQKGAYFNMKVGLYEIVAASTILLSSHQLFFY